MTKKKPVNLYKAAKKSAFYIFLTGLIVAMLLPVFFIVSLSFLSTREAYRFPLPLVPALTAKFELTTSERGYLLSVYDRNEKEYNTVLDTAELEKMEVYFEAQLGTTVTIPEIEEQIAKLDSQDVVRFSKRKNLLANYDTFFKVTRDAVPALIRSLQICALTILISLSIGGMAGYAFARYVFKGRNALKFSVLFVRMFPGVAIALPMVIILANTTVFGRTLYDEPLGLSLVYSIGSIGLTVWITASIFLGIPQSLEEAALVFGATKFQAFMRITLPLALPGLAAAAMYSFLGAWNETVSAIILTQFKPTFAVVVYQTLVGATGQVNLAAAGGMTMALPAIIFTFFIRKYINQMWGGVTV
ncbi:MAG: carbohydrate ABC transporter permease, partial [Chloroflexi bacterium]|nr:carbohydrate ABC transporter permease [Chloroflexota bacterium]